MYYIAGDGAYSVAVGDFDRDGGQDLITANESSDDVAVLMGHGDGTFGTAIHYAGAMGLSPSRWVTSIRTAEKTLSRPTSIPTLSPCCSAAGTGVRRSLSYAAGDDPRSVAVSSVNGNGSQDILIANERSSDVTLLSGHRDGTFAAGESYSTSIAAGSIAIGDFDSGRVARCRHRSPRLGISVLINQHDTRMIEVDIKPGSSPNSINPFSRGVIPVALLGGVTFDVADVDESSLAFGPGGAPIAHQYAHLEDVNYDASWTSLHIFEHRKPGLFAGTKSASWRASCSTVKPSRAPIRSRRLGATRQVGHRCG